MDRKMQNPSEKQKKTHEKDIWKAQDYATFLIPIQQVIDIKYAFDIFDVNQSGKIDPQELAKAFSELGFHGYYKNVHFIHPYLSVEPLQDINFADFFKMATAHLETSWSRLDTDLVWASFDLNRAGKITMRELKKVARDIGQELTQEEFEHMFSKADLDDDGFVTSYDFYNIMMHKVYWEE